VKLWNNFLKKSYSFTHVCVYYLLKRVNFFELIIS